MSCLLNLQDNRRNVNDVSRNHLYSYYMTGIAVLTIYEIGILTSIGRIELIVIDPRRHPYPHLFRFEYHEIEILFRLLIISTIYVHLLTEIDIHWRDE